MNKIKWAGFLIPFLIIGCGDSTTSSELNATEVSKIALGKLLFNDTNLSSNRTMSCATCHNPDNGFVDGRTSTIGHAAAASADGTAFGDRNVPTASYTAFIPNFGSVKENGETLFIGGQFLDGRAKDLQAQAKGPFLNAVEMQMTDETAVMDRIKERSSYITAFQEIYGDDIFNDVNTSYEAVANAIAAFEKTDLFAPFNSKYDRYLKGEYSLTTLEQKGLTLFANEEGANCIACHPLVRPNGTAGLFTDFTYDNLGVPVNTTLRTANGKGTTFVDNGLFENSAVSNTSLKGAFRVSSLRNVGVTAPYMHNGIFSTLKTVVHFYNTRDVQGAINPETGNVWRSAEVPATVNHSELGNLGLSDADENALVAFMETLTDKRYE